jgi:YesN/AraC family two-component response regulator
VCGEAENGSSGVKKFRELKPDLVLLDLAMPDIDGIEAGRQMHAPLFSTPHGGPHHQNVRYSFVE